MSVIIASYNGADVIAHAIESALTQEDVTLEVIVVDDGSTDGAPELVERYCADHPVTLLRQPQNRGISATRNAGIGAARGDFIGFLDQDDFWYPTRLRSGMAGFAGDVNGQVGLVFGREETRDLTTGALQPGRTAPPDDLNTMARCDVLAALIQTNFIPTAATLFRRSCFDELGVLNTNLRSGIDDFEMFLRIARNYEIRHIPEVQAIRHVHSGNYTKLARMVPEMLDVLVQIAANEPGVARVAGRARAHYLYLLAREQQSGGEYLAAARSLVQALRWNPLDWKSWAALLLCTMGPLNRLWMARPARAGTDKTS